MSYLDSAMGMRLAIAGLLAPAVAFLLAGLLALLCRRASAALRHLVWLLAFVSMAIWLPLALFHVQVGVPILSPTPPRPGAAAVLPVLPWQEEPERPAPAFDHQMPEYMVTIPLPKPAPVARRATGISVPRVDAAERRSLPWGALMPVVWIGGVAIFTFQWQAGILHLRRVIAHSRKVEDGSLRVLWLGLCSMNGMRRTVRLSSSANVSVPLVTGLLRPQVILPEAALTWPLPMLRAALIHELAHIRRNDLFSSAFARLVTVLYWFHPLAWRGLRALQNEAEMAADDCVVLLEAQPVIYAESLVALVRTFHESGPLPVAAIGMLRRASIEARVERILDPNRRRRAPRRVIRLAALTGAVLLTGGLVILRPVVAVTPSPLADPAALLAAPPLPFAPVSFSLEDAGGARLVAKAPPLLVPGEKHRLEFGAQFNYKIEATEIEYYGVRLDFPLGPVRIDYGVPLPQTGTPDGPFNHNGDFPGPGYREQKPLPTGPAISAAEGEEVSSDLQKAIVEGCVSSLRGVASIRFTMKTETTYAGAYLLRNPHQVQYDHRVTVYEGLMAGERFRVSSNITQADGQRFPEVVQAYDGQESHLLSKDRHPWLSIRRSYRFDSDTAFDLGTAVFLPYAFFYLTTEDEFVPNLSMRRLTDRAAWAAAFRKARVVERNETAGLIQLKFVLGEGGTYYLVTFSTDDGYYPISFEKYGPGGLAQRYLVEQFRVIGVSGGPGYRYAQKAKFETFLHGWQRNIITIDTTALTVNEETKADEFSLNTGLAENIIDEDK
ncbi:MAG: M56 family metallopeptidase [Chthoniobacter sp.]